jgi:hypothetical protein
MRLLNSLDALDADKYGGHYKSETDDDGRNRLRLSMPVWVFFVGCLIANLGAKKIRLWNSQYRRKIQRHLQREQMSGLSGREIRPNI